MLGRWAWRAWRFVWNAEPGEYELCCRARDADGNEQPLEPVWNVGGYANNAVQRVPVAVTA
jgi:Mo-co oxidoreductase dimerisation domain